MNSKLLSLALATISMLAYGGKYDAEGGHLVKWPDNHGVFFFVDARTAKDAKPLDAATRKITSAMGFDFRRAKGAAPDIRAVPVELHKLGARGAIWIVDDPALPVSLAATESGWGMLNVAPIIAASKGDEALFEKRTLRCLARLFGDLHGVADPMQMPACVMKSAVGIEGVDALLCDDYSPESFAKIRRHMAKMGYKPARRGSYLEACEEGWAPAPTNAVQKKIWDDVHQMPTKPIKILPPSKQQKK